jgi:hypothetical protein
MDRGSWAAALSSSSSSRSDGGSTTDRTTMDTTTGSALASPYVKFAIAAAALYAAYRYGPGPVKAFALGAAGFMLANQVPVVRDGLTQRLAAK